MSCMEASSLASSRFPMCITVLCGENPFLGEVNSVFTLLVGYT